MRYCWIHVQYANSIADSIENSSCIFDDVDIFLCLLLLWYSPLITVNRFLHHCYRYPQLSIEASKYISVIVIFEPMSSSLSSYYSHLCLFLSIQSFVLTIWQHIIITIVVGIYDDECKYLRLELLIADNRQVWVETKSLERPNWLLN